MSWAPAFSIGSSSSMARAMETPSLITWGLPYDCSNTTFLPAQTPDLHDIISEVIRLIHFPICMHKVKHSPSMPLLDFWLQRWHVLVWSVHFLPKGEEGRSGTATQSKKDKNAFGAQCSPLGPRVTPTASASLLIPICIFLRDSLSKMISFAAERICAMQHATLYSSVQ